MKSEQEWREHREWGKVFQAEGTASQEAQHTERSWCLEDRKFQQEQQSAEGRATGGGLGKGADEEGLYPGNNRKQFKSLGAGKWHHHICISAWGG